MPRASSVTAPVGGSRSMGGPHRAVDGDHRQRRAQRRRRRLVSPGRAGGAGTLSVESSVISGNEAEAGGGGLYTYGCESTVASSTIAGTRRPTEAAALTHVRLVHDPQFDDLRQLQRGSGGGIVVADGVLTLENSTISGNTAGEEGGGIAWPTPRPRSRNRPSRTTPGSVRPRAQKGAVGDPVGGVTIFEAPVPGRGVVDVARAGSGSAQAAAGRRRERERDDHRRQRRE